MNANDNHSSILLLVKVCVAAWFIVPGSGTQAQVSNGNADVPAMETIPLQVIASNDVTISTSDDSVRGQELRIETTGYDPYVIWKIGRPSWIPGVQVLEFDYFSVQPIDNLSAYLGPPITESTHFDLPELVQAEGWQNYAADLESAFGQSIPLTNRLVRLDFGMRKGIQFQLRNVHLRKRTQKEEQLLRHANSIRETKLAKDRSIRNYLRSEFAHTIEQIDIGEETITVVSDCSRPARLIEFPVYLSIGSKGIPAAVSQVQAGKVRFQVPRYVDGRDRVNSGWRLAAADDSGEFFTPRHYASSIPLAESSAPIPIRLYPRSQKGLGGVDHGGPLEDVRELGVSAITINLVLNRFVTTEGGEAQDRIGGNDDAPLFFDHRQFAPYDRTMDFARKHGIVVSAIVLIPRAKDANARSILVHPESDGGVYAMPNLTSQDAAKVYTNVLDRIARRYRDPLRAPGGITHWIAHNEIDFHTVWTNMGRQPRSVVTETYYRSMRLIYGVARRYNPHAEVFVSLTHHWVAKDDGRWQRLAPKEMLTALQRYSDLEGDFDWGIAYHPYPESLFATVAWSDRSVTNDLNTPLITIQNLHVLGRFLEQDSMRNRHEKVRTVILSEQGFHTKDYSESIQQFQAESLSFAMQKIKQMPWIESFHYHRWIDHPAEGGLKLGLRTLPTPSAPYGVRKRAWYVYQAIR